MDIVLGVGAHAVPVGHAPPQLLDDEVRQDPLVLPGEDQRLDVDVLLVHPVQDHGVGEVVDDRVNGDLRVKQDQDHRVEHHVEAQGELPHSEGVVPLAHDQADHVQSAAAAAAGEDDAAAQPGEDAPQQAGRQVVVHNGLGGDRDDAVEEGVGDRADDGPHRQAPPQIPVSHDQQGDIQQEIENARDVVCTEAQPQIGLKQGADQLAKALQCWRAQAQDCISR